MNKTQQTQAFFQRYMDVVWEAVARKDKIDKEFLSQFISDPKLIDHILFFNKSFPGYRLVPKEIIATENKIFMRVEFQGVHAGQAEEIPPTFQKVETPFALMYTIEDDMIVDFWAIANELEFFQQLGLTKDQVEVPIRH